MSPKIPTRRSPRTPTQPTSSTGYLLYHPEQPTYHNPQQEHQMARHTSIGPRKSSLALSTRRSSRAGSQQAGASGGVVGLPGAVDEFIDPSLFNENVDYDSFLNPNAYNDTESYMAFDPTDNWSTNQLQDTNMLETNFGQSSGSGLGISMPHAQVEQVPRLGSPFNSKMVIDYSQPSEAPNLSGNDGIRKLADLYSELPGNNYWNTQPLDSMTGLAAIPRGQKFSPELPRDFPNYPDLNSATYSTGPYFRAPITQYTGYIPVDPRLEEWGADMVQQGLGSDYPNARRLRNKDNATTQSTNKRKRIEHNSDSESEDEASLTKRTIKREYVERDSDSESEDKVPSGKGKNVQTQPRSSRRDSSVSESSSLAKPTQVAVVRAGEKPKKCEDKSWIRINNTTKGETTRTARINQFTDGGKTYKVKPIPVGNWAVEGGHRFEYVNNHGMDEFSKRSMSASRVYEYITQYPGDNLRIWIQVTPGDSARRYASKTHSECIFRACPNRVWANKGTIEVGNYRVAFDEKHKQYGKGVVDPFDCVGYAHLYCMERFLDFAGICRHADVKVDTRNDMKKEPKGEPAFAFSKKHVPERMLAEKFIKAAQLGRLRETPEFSNYPVHKDYGHGEAKPHERTLTSAMFRANWEHRPRSQLKQFVYRTVKPSSCGIHRGDQEIIVADKMIEALKVYKKAKGAKQHKNFNYSAHYDKINPEINIRIAECAALRAQFEKDDATGIAPSRKKKQQKRRIDDVEDSDDDEKSGFIAPTRNKKQGRRKVSFLEDYSDDDDDDEEREFWNNDDDEDDDLEAIRTQRVKSRSSPRKKQRVNYAEPQDMLPEPQHRRIGFSQPDTIHVQTSPISPKTRQSSIGSRLFAAIGTQYTMPDETLDLSNIPTPTQEQIDIKLERRKSSAVGPQMSIMKSPEVSRNLGSPRTARTASFDAQPVTSSKEYNVNDPPRRVAAPLYRRRSSARLASK